VSRNVGAHSPIQALEYLAIDNRRDAFGAMLEAL
jgi:hypothetical protein